MSTGRAAEQPIDISEVTAACGLPASTLHVWEKRGLLRPVGRKSERRQYDPAVLDHITIIIVMQRSGFTLSEIGELLEPDAFADGKAVLQTKLDTLVEQREALDQAISGLQHAIDCPAPSPLDCGGFRRHLDGVLPVKRRRGVG